MKVLSYLALVGKFALIVGLALTMSWLATFLGLREKLESSGFGNWNWSWPLVLAIIFPIACKIFTADRPEWVTKHWKLALGLSTAYLAGLFVFAAGVVQISAQSVRQWAPLTLFFTSMIFGLCHGVNPILNQTGSFAWSWFLGTFLIGLVFGAIFLKTRSLGLTGLGHFILNTAGIFFIPAEKLIKDLTEVGFVRWP